MVIGSMSSNIISVAWLLSGSMVFNLIFLLLLGGGIMEFVCVGEDMGFGPFCC